MTQQSHPQDPAGWSAPSGQPAAAAFPPPLPSATPQPSASQPVEHRPSAQEPPSRFDPAMLHVTEATRTYPCPACGGMLAFEPDSQALVCTSCGNTLPVSAEVARPAVIPKRELSSAMSQLAALQANATTSVSGDKEVVCQSCGGHTVFTGTLTAIRCPYCNTPIQRDDVQAAPTRLAIDGILPLQVGAKRAREAIEKWINTRRFAPNAFKKYRDVGSFTSVYLSYFSYDAATTTSYTGQRGIHRTETYRDSEGRTQTRIVTDWYPASGVVRNRFEDVTGHANTGLDDQKVTELEPWPMQYSRPYSPEFVAGHLCRTYDQDANQVFGALVEPRMEGVIDSTIRNDIGGNEQRIFSRDITWHTVAFSQLLLPVWMLTVTYKAKPFRVFINGITGEVQGRRPWSAVKITLAILAGILLLVVLYALYTYFGAEPS
ncbi:hypothetical protein GCM10009785_23210 [Brooklawnia cerclae]|uniref:RNA-binding Zn-ribbon protein involved in translation (DUF1610 family) n=1 Tax=Brooklawnia cerclae TaxID=349934 RepID=A0ABX0SGK4_9ACTN|nr:hypothetical protein [Brooklawnia cerclae]NIH57044.1 putative RNA-binding Zn-ribbon protein involved in translation (DUF1610 family) [Brooklawnia cerclae]